MGCDIHLFVERLIDGKWCHVPAPECWDNDKLELVASAAEVPSWARSWFSDRNYNLFSWLAGVRDYGEKNTPLAKPRGVPGNASLEVRRERRRWGVDGHSGSRFTVAELQAGLVGLVVRYSGQVDESTYLKWKASGEAFPDSWCQSSSASEQILELDYLNGKRAKSGRHTGVWCNWSVPAGVAFQRFEKLVSVLAQIDAPHNVRIVFWFDN